MPRKDSQDKKSARTIETLESRLAEADAVAEIKSNFLANMSHEMRTPMQTVYGFLELIELEKPAPNVQDMVRTAKGAASSLLEILDDILDFAKMDAEKLELDDFEVPVRTLVRGTLEALSVKVQGGQVELLDDIAQDVPSVVIGDPKRLRQVLMNLCGNALKFTKEGRVTIRVTVDQSAGKQKPNKESFSLTLRFEVIDTGIGMPPHVSEKLFQPFTQANSSTARTFGGTGLGLSICKKLVEIMNGDIGVESDEGEGSTFWFTLPTQKVRVDASTLEPPDLEGISVLSVEDHPKGAQEIVRSLGSMGADVDSVGNVEEARDLIRRRPFDVAIIDQGLPDGLGIDLIREVMQLRPFMSMIMYTVRDDIGLQHTCQSLGVTYLSKPASRIGLGSAVQDAAQKNRALRYDGQRRLLIAEDTTAVRDVIGRQLKTLGVEADFVENGIAALEALKKGEYGILLTDLHMPEADGYDVIQAIRKAETATDNQDPASLETHFPVVVLTADVQMAQRQVYLSHGFDECLLKPVSLAQLRRLLYRWGLLDGDTVPTSPTIVTSASPDDRSLEAVDLSGLAAHMGASEAEAIEMLKAFPELSAGLLHNIEDAWSVKDMKGVAEAAHSLKGAARSASCSALGDAAAALLEAAHAGTASQGTVNEVWKRFAEVEAAIRKL